MMESLIPDRNFGWLCLGLSAYMTTLWLLRRPLKNDSLVDFGWPSSFAAIGLFYGLTGDGHPLRRWIIAALYMTCGLRMAIGFAVRTWQLGPDRRFDLWRQRWVAGDGLFGVRNVSLNFFFFYQIQNIANLMVIAVPARLIANDGSPDFRLTEFAALSVWVLSFLLENVADLQLYLFRIRHRGTAALLDKGLWRYSRHPNYFFEFLIWTCYSVAALPLSTNWWDTLRLVMLPPVAYWFLVHFTGIPMTEQASLAKRGAPYLEYQRKTSRFFPWFPRV